VDIGIYTPPQKKKLIPPPKQISGYAPDEFQTMDAAQQETSDGRWLSDGMAERAAEV